MGASESKFTPEYAFLDDSRIFTLQMLLDNSYLGMDLEDKEKRENAKKDFVFLLNYLFKQFQNKLDLLKILMRFLAKNQIFLTKGGVWKGNDLVVQAIAAAMDFIRINNPKIFEQVDREFNSWRKNFLLELLLYFQNL